MARKVEDNPALDLEMRLEKIRIAEGLETREEAVWLVLEEYDEFLSAYPGGFSQFCIDYRGALGDMEGKVRAAKMKTGDFVREAFPNTFLWKKGVKGVVEKRHMYRAHARHRLQRVDRSYSNAVREVLAIHGMRMGYAEKVALDAASLIGDRLEDLAYNIAPLEMSLEELGHHVIIAEASDLEDDDVRELLERLSDRSQSNGESR